MNLRSQRTLLRGILAMLAGVLPMLTAGLHAAAAQSAAQSTTLPGMHPESVPPMPFYTLHPGDAVTVTFRFTPEYNDDAVVQPDGRISLKATGDIYVVGDTLPELQREIERASAAKLVDPDVAVTLKDFERPRFVVAGEVQLPGRFELRQPTTALQAVLLAGGPKEDSALNHVYLFRRLSTTHSEVRVLKLNRVDSRTRAANDVILQPNDMILVQRDELEKIGRVLKLFNLGVYLNPLPQSGLF